MRVTSDQQAGVLRIVLTDSPIDKSDEDKSGMIIDYDRDGNLVGLEVLDASKRIENPRSLDYAVTG